VAQAAELSLAFNRLSRSVRQTIALQAKLAGARRREGREDAAEAQRADEDRGQRRKAQVRHAVERLIWTETESDAEAERLVDELDEMVSEEMLYDGFGDEAVEAHIARLSAELGVTPPATACPTDAGEGTAPAPEAPGLGWRSSA
jgi:hypothetical protein